MCASVNVPCKGEPRCPLVPKLTSWFGSPKSGRRSKYSFSRRATSISISFGAGLPASGSSLRLIFIMPVWVIPGTAVLDFFHGEAEHEHVLLSCLLRHLDGRAIACTDG